MIPPATAPPQTARSFRGIVYRDILKDETAKLVWSISLLAAAMGLTTTNPLVTSASLLIPPLLFQLLWRSGEPPVLLYAASFQWLQVVAPIISANLDGITLLDRFRGPQLEQAVWLSLGGLVCLAWGMRVATNRLPSSTLNAYRKQSDLMSNARLYRAYIACYILSLVFTYIGVRLGSIRQAMLALATIRWIPVILLVWKAAQSRHYPGGLIFIILSEIVTGFLGFFSSFKTILLLLIVVVTGASTSRGRLSLRTIAPIVVLTVFLAIFWQCIKIEYRAFLNQGNGQQIVKVSVVRRLEFIALSATAITPEAMYKGLVTGVERLGYLNYFAYCIRNVPRTVPYQNGDLWGGAIMHVLKPRLLFPNKPSISDSKRTNKFTGLSVASEDRGTSISIGYMGESYIDFGPFGMFVPIFLLGYFYGALYRWFSRLAGYELLGLATGLALLQFSAHLIESSNIKIVGGITAGAIVLGIVLNVWRYRIWNLLIEPAPSLPARPAVRVRR